MATCVIWRGTLRSRVLGLPLVGKVAAVVVLALIAASCGSGESETEVASLEATTEPVPEQPGASPIAEAEPEEQPIVAPEDDSSADAEPPEPAVPGSGGNGDDTPQPAEPTEPAEPIVVHHVEGHRGARGLKPENTLPAFETALDIGVKVLELDLHFTADDQVVVWHDDTLTAEKCRLVDGGAPNLVDGDVAIRSLTLDELSSYRCDLNPDPGRFPDQTNGGTALAGDRYQLATLGELFEFVAEYAASSEKTNAQRERAAVVEFNIETKRDTENPGGIGDGFDGISPGPFELAVLATVESAGLTDRVVIQSFDHRSLWAVRSVNSTIRLAALTGANAPDFEAFSENDATIWSPNFNLVTVELIEEAHGVGLLVIPWTVNEVADMERLLDMGVAGFITDRPDVAVQLDW